jgi:small conductance mechanosensitive channel
MQELINNILAITDSKIIKALIVVLLALLAQKIINILIKNAFRYTVESNFYPRRKRDQEKRAKTLISVTSAISTLVVWAVSIIIIMSIYGLDISTILVSAGFMGAALAFGAQSSIRDFVNGFFMIVENQYRIDDYVEFDTLKGRVEKISIRTTVVRDEEGKLHNVPNGSVVIATNLSMGSLHAHEQIDLSPKITIDEFESKLQKIAREIAGNEGLAKVIKDGPILAKINKMTNQSTVVTISFTTSAPKRQQATNIIWKQLEQQKIPLAG